MTTTVASVVLDAQGLSAWVENDRQIESLLKRFSSARSRLVISANTIIEVSHARSNLTRLNWVLSQIRVEPVTKESARAAAALLKQAGVHGHEHAIDATVAEVALRQPRPVALVTSDVDDLMRLCGDRVGIIPV